MVCASAHPAYR